MLQMNRILISSLALTGLVLSLPAQTTKPKKNPEVKKRLKEFTVLVSDREASKDDEARKILDWAVGLYPNMHSTDQRYFTNQIGPVLRSTRIKRDVDRADLYRWIIVALGKAGTNGSGQLVATFEHKKFKGEQEWRSLRGLMLEHLGRTKDVRQIGFLLEVAMRDPNDSLMASAGGALRHFADAKLRVRKDIVKDLNRKFAEVYDNAHKNLDTGDTLRQTWERRHSVVADDWNNALRALTKQQLSGSNAWTRFWNKNKDKDWDKIK